MSTANNESRAQCVVTVNSHIGWVKDKKRNVITADGEKWSFSVYSNPKTPECRQVYEDTVGFIGYDQMSGRMVKYRVANWQKYKVSRISPSGVKAYNVIVKYADTTAL